MSFLSYFLLIYSSQFEPTLADQSATNLYLSQCVLSSFITALLTLPHSKSSLNTIDIFLFAEYIQSLFAAIFLVKVKNMLAVKQKWDHDGHPMELNVLLNQVRS